MPDFLSHRTIFNIKEDKIYTSSVYTVASQVVLVVKNLSANAGDIKSMGSIPGLGRSPGGGNPTYILACRIPWTEEPGELRPWGRKESYMTEAIYHRLYMM